MDFNSKIVYFGDFEYPFLKETSMLLFGKPMLYIYSIFLLIDKGPPPVPRGHWCSFPPMQRSARPADGRKAAGSNWHHVQYPYDWDVEK